jgi:hypothetical protein
LQIGRGLFHVLLVPLGDFRLLLVALVQVKAITEGDALASGHSKIAGSLIRADLEIMLAKGVGRK